MKVNAAATLPASTALGAEAAPDRLSRARGLWKSGILVFGAFGLLSGFVGLVLSLEYYIGLTGTSLSSIGTILIVFSFPLLFLAAHCMDKVRSVDKAIRLEYCRKHGLKDEDC